MNDPAEFSYCSGAPRRRSRAQADDGRGRGTSVRPTKAIVLAVDDEPDILAIIQWYLREEGFIVRTATNGCAALQSVQACVPDVAVIDYMMPGMNGIALCLRLREQTSTQHLPIILHTAADLTAAELNQTSCIDRVVTKPSDARDLVREIRELLRRSH